MPTIGVRELRQQTSEVLRKIKEEKAEYVVTHQGHPVAVLLPVDAQAVEQAILQVGKRGTAQAWDAYAQIAARVRQQWPKSTTSQDALDQIRR